MCSGMAGRQMTVSVTNAGMTTFVAVDDAKIVALIRNARRSLVYVAPGVWKPVADALGRRLAEDRIPVRIVLDTDPEVCRLGYGDKEALADLHALAVKEMLVLHHQPGIRVGIVVADDTLVVFAPAPRLIEAGSSTDAKPNGIVLGDHSARTVERAVGADTSDVTPVDAEIGRSAVTPQDLKATQEELEKVPPAQFDLARRTRVFSSRLQFVELEAKGLRFSQQKIRLPQDLLHADAQHGLAEELTTHISLTHNLADKEIELYLDADGEYQVAKGAPSGSAEVWTAKRLNKAITRLRDAYLIPIPGYGSVLKIIDKPAFESEARKLASVTKAFRAAVTEQFFDVQAVEIGRLTMLVLNRLGEKRPEGMRPRDYPSGITAEDTRKYVEDRLGQAYTESIQSEGSLTWVYKSIAPESLADPRFRVAINRLAEPLRSTVFSYFDVAEAMVVQKPI